MRIIPAIDLYEGKCVRLTEGDYARKKEYSVDPAATAMRFLEAGSHRLHLVDLEGAKAGRVVNWPALEQILALKELSAQVGGGVRTREEIAKLLELGAAGIVVGSVAIRSPQILQNWIRRFGAERFCVAVDVKDGVVASNAWQSKEDLKVEEVVSNTEQMGIKTFLCTDIAKDGNLNGPNFHLYETLVQEFPSLEWLASGGITTKEDLLRLREIGLAGAIVGKALYEGLLNLGELMEIFET